MSNDFIAENVAIKGARRIGIFDANGNRVGQIPLGPLTPPNPAKRLYTFCALSDTHIGKAEDANEQEDFARALAYLNNDEDVAFTCVCGDLTDGGSAAQLSEFKSRVDTYSPDTPVYAITGNHDGWNASIEDVIETYTGHPLYYSFTHGNDVYVMVGIKNDADVFTTAELTWLENTLEANKNKRVFLFQHALRFDGCGNPYPAVNPTYDMLNKDNGKTFTSLISAYPNVIWFHGHSHTAFECQKDNPIANYDRLFSIHSIHIPSLSSPRTFNGAAYVSEYAESQGYVVDVYENGIHLRGRDFVRGEYLPIASYWLET